MTEPIPRAIPNPGSITNDLLRSILAELRAMRQELALSRVAQPAKRPATSPIPISKLLEDDPDGTFIVEEK